MKIYSPRITNFSWGHIKIEGNQQFKDVKCFPNGVRAWDWNETGTKHTPGIKPTDVQELLDNGAACIVLSTGVLGRLQICSETLQLLNSLKIPVHVLKTEKAIELYNKLSKTELVGGLFHSTC